MKFKLIIFTSYCFALLNLVSETQIEEIVTTGSFLKSANEDYSLIDTISKDSIEDMVERVQSYVPGYRLKQEVQFERFGSNNPCLIPGYGEFEGLKASIFLEVEGPPWPPTLAVNNPY